jgi:hypothetical protein
MTIEWDDRLWGLANIVTGFAVAQSIALLYALGKDLRDLHKAPMGTKKWIAIPIGLFSCFYVGAVWGLAWLAIDSDPSEDSIWLWVMVGRSVAIGAFGLFALASLFAPEIEQNLKQTSDK